MNQTIEKLIYKADIVYGEDKLIAATTTDLEKFAGLIVQDCAEEIAKVCDVWSGTDTKQLARYIRQRFGVTA
jgi:hypothetical protein